MIALFKYLFEKIWSLPIISCLLPRFVSTLMACSLFLFDDLVSLSFGERRQSCLISLDRLRMNCWYSVSTLCRVYSPNPIVYWSWWDLCKMLQVADNADSDEWFASCHWKSTVFALVFVGSVAQRIVLLAWNSSDSKDFTDTYYSEVQRVTIRRAWLEDW